MRLPIFALLVVGCAAPGLAACAGRGGEADPIAAALRAARPHPDDAKLVRVDRLLGEAALDRNPPEARVAFARAALDDLGPLLAAAPRDPELHYLAALGHLALFDAQAPALDPAEAARADAELLAARRLAPEGGRAFDVALQRGLLLARLARYPEAVDETSVALALHEVAGPFRAGGDPQEQPAGMAALLHGNLGDLLTALDRLGEALPHYRLAVELTPRRAARAGAMPHYALAVALYRSGRADAAGAELKLALARDPGAEELEAPRYFFLPPADKHFYLALVRRAQGRPDAAADALRKYLASAPPAAYGARARVLLDEIAAAPPSLPSPSGTPSPAPRPAPGVVPAGAPSAAPPLTPSAAPPPGPSAAPRRVP